MIRMQLIDKRKTITGKHTAVVCHHQMSQNKIGSKCPQKVLTLFKCKKNLCDFVLFDKNS